MNSVSIVVIEVRKRQLQKLMLVFPLDLAGGVFLGFAWWWRRISDLSDQIGGRGFCDAIYEHTEEGYLQQEKESKGESKEDTFTISEPLSLLLFGIVYPGKVWLQKIPHQASRCKVALQEDNKISFGKEDCATKYHGGWLNSNCLLKSVKTGGRQYERTHKGDKREKIHCQGHGCSPSIPGDKRNHGICGSFSSLGRMVQTEIGIIKRS